MNQLHGSKQADDRIYAFLLDLPHIKGLDRQPILRPQPQLADEGALSPFQDDRVLLRAYRFDLCLG